MARLVYEGMEFPSLLVCLACMFVSYMDERCLSGCASYAGEHGRAF